jgi:ribonuclease P protein component
VLPAGNRLRSSGDFSAALRGRGSARAGSALIVVHASSVDARAGRLPRVGFVVSKAVGGAVVRNRVKRRLRAQMVTRLDRIPAGTDVVVRANPVAAQAISTDLGRDLDRLLGRVLSQRDGAGS